LKSRRDKIHQQSESRGRDSELIEIIRIQMQASNIVLSAINSSCNSYLLEIWKWKFQKAQSFLTGCFSVKINWFSRYIFGTCNTYGVVYVMIEGSTSNSYFLFFFSFHVLLLLLLLLFLSLLFGSKVVIFFRLLVYLPWHL
jgi:hypothetical protein